MVSKPHKRGSSFQGKGVYLVLGEEDCLRDQAIEKIRRDVSAGSTDANPSDARMTQTPDADLFAFHVLYGDETNAREILACVQEVPFLATHQVVLLKWADKLPAREGEGLVPYFSSPSDSTTLIISAAKLDGRMKWVQALKKQAVAVDCAPLRDNQPLGWIRQEAARLSLRLDPEAAGLLKDMAGDGLYRVRRELEKVSLYLPRGETVKAQDVLAVQGMEPGASVFDLAGTIMQADYSSSLNVLEKNLETGQAPLQILGALLWQYRRLWKAKDGLSRGVGESVVGKSLGIPPFRQRAFFAGIKRIPLSHFPEAFALFSQTDRSLKGGAAGSPHCIMRVLIFDLCRSAQRGNPLRK